MDEAAAASIALNCRDAGLCTKSGEEKGVMKRHQDSFQPRAFIFIESAAKSLEASTLDHNDHLRDFFLEPSLDRALVAVVGLDDRFRFDLDEEVERP